MKDEPKKYPKLTPKRRIGRLLLHYLDMLATAADTKKADREAVGKWQEIIRANYNQP